MVQKGEVMSGGRGGCTENKKKKIKMETVLFRRNIKDIQICKKELRVKQDLSRQKAYFDEAYSGRLYEEEPEAQWILLKI